MRITVTGNSRLTLPAECVAVSVTLGFTGPDRGSVVADTAAVTDRDAVIAITGHETLLSFSLMQAAMMFCFGLVMSNFGAIAMEPLGHVAGAAASIQGFITTIGGALFGFIIGQMFDGTTVPLTLGFMGFGLAGLVTVLATEKGKLFQAGAPAPASAAAH